ncbi:MAG: hypothetical protein ACI814_002089 [Mariniblastus sp.]|jgi:hypothetical protein
MAGGSRHSAHDHGTDDSDRCSSLLGTFVRICQLRYLEKAMPTATLSPPLISVTSVNYIEFALPNKARACRRDMRLGQGEEIFVS